MSRILRIANSLLVVLALVLLGAAWWFLYRPTPQTSGTIQAPVAAPLTIARDSRGIPHIRAASIEDALFAQGFATAQDRLWQMDTLRRLAAGELAEIVGKAALPLDLDARKFRMRHIATAWAQSLPPQARRYLAAYARGVNHYIEANPNNWSPEFAALQYSPRPWLITDTLLCALQMHRTLSGHWEEDKLLGKLLNSGAGGKALFLFPTRLGNEPLPGSNSWALSGAHTSTGKPLLANDPHLEWSLPSTWHMVHLSAPGLNVSGATLPGVPAVTVGHNDRISWGITALQFDNMDLYAEQIDLRTGIYTYQGQPRQAARESEWIAIKGDKPLAVTNFVTLHGPVFTAEGNTHMALRWAGADTAQFDFPLVELNQAANWDQFRSALRRLPAPNINVTYADVDGNIGLQIAGSCPIRNDFDGNRPLDGASGTQEWAGYIPFDDLPSYYNPPSGLVVTANQNPFPANYKYRVNGFFASPHRALAITNLLQSRPKWKPEEMQMVQKDVYSAFLHFLANQAVHAVETRGDRTPAALEGVQLLRAWNGQMLASEPQPFLATLLYQHLRRAISENVAGKDAAAFKSYMAPGVIEKLLRERPKGWFDDYDQLLSTELAGAVEEAHRMQGKNSAKWSYGRLNELTLAHPVAARIPWLSSYYNLGPVPLNGAATTINAAGPKMGPSMRFIADLANWENSRLNLTTGQSIHRFSGHYKDDWDTYLSGESKLLPFQSAQPKNTLTLNP